MFEKTSPVKPWPLNPAVKVACLIDSIPRIVIGQLFMKLAPTVTIKLGASTPKTDGNALVVTKAEAKSSVTPAFFNP